MPDNEKNNNKTRTQIRTFRGSVVNCDVEIVKEKHDLLLVGDGLKNLTRSLTGVRSM